MKLEREPSFLPSKQSAELRANTTRSKAKLLLRLLFGTGASSSSRRRGGRRSYSSNQLSFIFLVEPRTIPPASVPRRVFFPPFLVPSKERDGTGYSAVARASLLFPVFPPFSGCPVAPPPSSQTLSPLTSPILALLPGP